MFTSSGDSPPEATSSIQPSFNSTSYLNIDPNYLRNSADEYILLEGAEPVRSRVQVMFSMVGAAAVCGAALGGLGSMRYTGLQLLRGRSERMQTTSAVLKNGGRIASRCGSVAVLYYVCSIVSEKSRGVDDEMNTLIGGATAGALYSLPAVMNAKKQKAEMDVAELGLLRRYFVRLPPLGKLLACSSLGLIASGLLSFYKNQVTDCIQNVSKRN